MKKQVNIFAIFAIYTTAYINLYIVEARKFFKITMKYLAKLI